MPKKYSASYSLSGLATGLALLLCPLAAQAVDYSIDIFSDASSETDGRNDGSSLDELETVIGLNFAVSHDGRQVDYAGVYRAQYADFAEDTNTERTSFDGSSEFVAELLPQRLNWLASHSVSDVAPSRRDAADIADDRQQRHQFSTGPFVTLPITPVDQLTFSANYAEQLFDSAENAALNTNEADSQSVSASVNWLHSLSAINRLVGGYQFQQFERDNSSDKTDFQTFFLGFTRTLRTLDYSLNIGGNSSQREGQSSESGFYYQADVRKTSGNQTFSASASRQKTESSLGISPLRFSADLSTPDQSELNIGQTYDNANIAGVVEITFLNADYTTSAFCKLCSYGAELSVTDSNYEATPINDDRATEAHLFYNYRITQNLTAALTGSYSLTEFMQLNQEDTGNSASLSLRWRATPRLNISAGAGYEEEDSEAGPNFYNGFGNISVTYNLITSKARSN